MKIGDKINLEGNEGIAATIPEKHLLDAGFRILTDKFPDGNTLSRIDIRYNNTQLSRAFNSTEAGNSILKSPESVSCLAINVSLKEILNILKGLTLEIEALLEKPQ